MENIQVNIRLKPTDNLINDDFNNLLVFEDKSKSIINKKTKERLTFDNIVSDKTTNEEIFSSIIQPQIIDFALKGINSTIFTYGQTSTGKTHTMKGNVEDKGIIPNVLHALFFQLKENSEIKASYYELYNENINDLLDLSKTNLEIREQKIEGLSEHKIKSLDQFWEIFNKGEQNRKIAETKLNDKSSRSHCIFKLEIRNGNLKSILNLVDLAGSENVSKAKTDGIRLIEGSNINKSLLSLSQVISKLSMKDSKDNKFINYRDSKLTRLLQPSLSGNSKTMIFCTISQSIKNYSETWNTLLFGSRAKCIKTTIKINEVDEKGKIIKENNLLRTRIKELERIVDVSASKSPLKSEFKTNLNSAFNATTSKNDKINALFEEFNQLKKLIMPKEQSEIHTINNEFSLLNSNMHCYNQSNSFNHNMNKMSDSAKKISDYGNYPNNISAFNNFSASRNFANFNPISDVKPYNSYFNNYLPTTTNHQREEDKKIINDLQQKLNIANTQFKNKIVHKEIQIKELENNLNYTIEGCERIIRESQENLHKQKEEIVEFKSRLNNKEIETQELYIRIKNLDTQNKMQLEHIKRLEVNIQNSDFHKIQYQNKELYSMNEKFAIIIKQKDQEIESLQERISNLIEENTNKQINYERSRTEKIQSDASIEILKKNSDLYLSENRKMKVEIDSYKVEIASLKDKIKKGKLNQSNGSGSYNTPTPLPDECSNTLVTLNKKLNKELADNKKILEQKQEEIIKAQKDLLDLKQENTDLQNLIDEVFEKMNDMEKELERKEQIVQNKEIIIPEIHEEKPSIPKQHPQYSAISDFSFQEGQKNTSEGPKDQKEETVYGELCLVEETEGEVLKTIKKLSASPNKKYTGILNILTSKKRKSTCESVNKTIILNKKKTDYGAFDAMVKNIKPTFAYPIKSVNQKK